MAWTAHTNPEMKKEYEEPEEELDKKAKILAQWISNSKHFVAFTGAGISTSAGIPDFRGPEGVWTLRAEGRVRTRPTTSTLQAIPTLSHMSLVQLQNKGIMKYLISQNTDGLHRKSGILPDKISELHGNSNIERCTRCGKEYLRDFSARTAIEVHDHKTGRRCALCGGELQDTIVNFNEPLPEIPLRKAFDNSRKADLILVLGSSLTVSPANTMPEAVKRNGGKVVICNLQKTPLDSIADLRIFAKTDALMKKVMENLGESFNTGHKRNIAGLEIPTFKLYRQLIVENKHGFSAFDEAVNRIRFRGEDVDGTPASFLQGVEVVIGDKTVRLDKEPFTVPLKEFEGPVSFSATLYFMGHYLEPPVKLDLTIPPQNCKYVYHMYYTPTTREWEIKQVGEKEVQHK